MLLDVFLPLGTIFLVVAIAFVVSVLVGLLLGRRLREADSPHPGRPTLPTRPPGG